MIRGPGKACPALSAAASRGQDLPAYSEPSQPQAGPPHWQPVVSGPTLAKRKNLLGQVLPGAAWRPPLMMPQRPGDRDRDIGDSSRSVPGRVGFDLVIAYIEVILLFTS